jgi:hypothetical protein
MLMTIYLMTAIYDAVSDMETDKAPVRLCDETTANGAKSGISSRPFLPVPLKDLS